jgi:DNA-binding MarR family transcriptional regulator
LRIFLKPDRLTLGAARIIDETMAQVNSARDFVGLMDELARIRGRIDTAFVAVRRRERFTTLEWVVFNAIAGAANPPTVPQIGRSLGHARQVVQRAATRLVALDLAVWIDNPDHKRARRLMATPKGKALKAQADEAGLQTAAEMVQGLDPALIYSAMASVRAIREHLEAKIRDG